MEIANLVKKVKDLDNGIYNYLPEDLNEIKQIEVDTYSYRADFFDEKKALFTERPEFTKPLVPNILLSLMLKPK